MDRIDHQVRQRGKGDGEGGHVGAALPANDLLVDGHDSDGYQALHPGGEADTVFGLAADQILQSCHARNRSVESTRPS